MTKKPMRSAFRHPTRRVPDGQLLRDVAAMIREFPHEVSGDQGAADELAHDVIVVIRERVLREIAGYARENIR